jgi:hypothetical protein
MKRVNGLQEMTRLLAGANYKLALEVDGKPAYDGQLKTTEIKETYGSIKKFLDGIVADYSPEVISAQYGLTNGSSWKNPTWIYCDLKATENNKKPLSLGFSDFQKDPFGLNGMEVPQGDSLATLQYKFLLKASELQKAELKLEQLSSKNENYKDKLDEYHEIIRDLKNDIEDLKRTHLRELEGIQKPSMIEKLLENPEVSGGLMKLLDQSNSGSAGLNAPKLTEYGQHVLSTMQSSPKIEKVLSRVLNSMNTNQQFSTELLALMHRFEASQNEDITVNA